MNSCSRWLGGLVGVLCSAAQAQQGPIDIDALHQRMLAACPAIWEDIRDDIDPAAVSGDHWQGDSDDRAAFISFVDVEMGDSSPGAAGLAAMAEDLATVAAECAAQRLGLLDGLINKLPNDALAAMAAVSEGMQAGSAALSQDGFLVGDIRMTGRPAAAEGWLFLTGQSIGAEGSGANLEGDEFEALFDLARTWAPSTGAEDFDTGDVVLLPDLRGRVVAGVDDMGGSAAGRLVDTAAAQVGGSIGAESHQLTVDQMPSHSHGMGSAGNHSHSYQDNSTHSGSSIASGSGRGNSNQSRTTENAGNHTHSIHSTGGNQPHPIVQPTVVFNVEMKYQ